MLRGLFLSWIALSLMALPLHTWGNSVDLERADNQQLIEAVMPNERFASLGLKEGETLIVRPRRIEVFVDEGNAI